jgi:hypothetical protein
VVEPSKCEALSLNPSTKKKTELSYSMPNAQRLVEFTNETMHHFILA